MLIPKVGLASLDYRQLLLLCFGTWENGPMRKVTEIGILLGKNNWFCSAINSHMNASIETKWQTKPFAIVSQSKCSQRFHKIQKHMRHLKACNVFKKRLKLVIQAGNYMFKVNNRNTRTRCEICSKLTIKTPEPRLASFWCLYY